MKLWKRLTALCLSALVCVTLLTACGRKESADGRASLSVCVGETPATYDPIYAQQIGDQTILNHLYENLMRLEKGENGQTTAVPGAAKSVDMKENSDGTPTPLLLPEYNLDSDGRPYAGHLDDETRTAYDAMENDVQTAVATMHEILSELYA